MTAHGAARHVPDRACGDGHDEGGAVRRGGRRLAGRAKFHEVRRGRWRWAGRRCPAMGSADRPIAGASHSADDMTSSGPFPASARKTRMTTRA
ncbi:hypothetical protein BURPS1655_A1439 [Burkholderia pseudomallei 1655]|nr:hypothetical protein BURPS1655_A1439 [Burkholderia pseudomallei 1655]